MDDDLKGPMGDRLEEASGDQDREIGAVDDGGRRDEGAADVADPLDEIVDRQTGSDR